ncbi:hypothetical protein KIF59_03545 [Enterobacter cloacae subsp. cloacae]|nr:hypothetical protein [Enterobacter cloacae subsp. cloacae]
MTEVVTLYSHMVQPVLDAQGAAARLARSAAESTLMIAVSRWRWWMRRSSPWRNLRPDKLYRQSLRY